jgi:DNA-directed RNA polymerase specialized sigma24 family protein
MPKSIYISKLFACLPIGLRNLAGDAACAARIERFLDQGCPEVMAEPIGGGGGDAGSEIRQALVLMPPLTRAVLSVMVGHKMSVAQVSRRFGINEARVRRHFLEAISMVAEYRNVG